MCATLTDAELGHLGDAGKVPNIFAPARSRTTVPLLIGITLAVLPPLLLLVRLEASQASRPGPCFNCNKPAYDFRSRAYSDVSELDYHIIWPGVSKITHERAAETFRMRVDKKVTLIVTRGPTTGNHTLPTCPHGEHVVEKIYAVLEGPAVVAPTGITETSDGQSIVSLIAYDPGVYLLHIEAIFSCSSANNNTIHRIRGSPFSVDVHGTASFPRKRCVDYRFRHGRWLECKQTPLLCARTGWVWVPRDCYSHVFSADEVINHDRHTWVVFAGTSVERGSFFSLVDHLLGDRASNLTQSDFWKCWGWSKCTLYIRGLWVRLGQSIE